MGLATLSREGPGRDGVFVLENLATLGSGPACQIRVAGAAPRHCHLARTPEGYALRDLTGQALVSVNGKRVSSQILRDGDIVQLGSEKFVFHETSEADPPSQPAEPPVRREAPSPISPRRPAPARPIRVHPGLFAAAAIAVVAVAAILLTSGGGDPAPRRDRAGAPPAGPGSVAPPSGTVQPPPVDDVSPAQRLARRVNLLVIAARLADLQGRETVSAQLRADLARTHGTLRSRIASWTPGRAEKLLPGHFREGDVLAAFDHEELATLDREKAARLLATFLAGLQPGARVRVASEGGGPRVDFTVYFEECPEESGEVAQLAGAASAVPSRAGEEPVRPALRAPVEPKQPSLTLVECAAVLRDPARRSAPADRAAAAEALAQAAGDAAALQFLAWALRRPEPWSLSGSAAEAWTAYLARFPVDAGLAPADHAALAGEILEKGAGSTLLRQAALAHLLEAGDERAAAAAGFRRSDDGRLWGLPDQILHHRLSRQFARPALEGEPPGAAGRSAAAFGARYAAVLLDVRHALARGERLQAAHAALLELPVSGGPRGAAEHLKALAASLKAPVFCKDCRNGQVACPQCQGKTRVDIDCGVCKGQGRVRASGAVAGADVTVKCRNCEGRKVFRDVGCPGCSKSGATACGSCKGKPWREGVCGVRECAGGRVPCGDCKGTGWKHFDCPVCQGKGRVRAPARWGTRT